MSLRKLVNGESIKIDNHNRGQGISIDDSGLHIHKRYNQKSRKEGSVDVILPLNGGKMEITKSSGANKRNIEKELSKAFSNDNIRQAFIDDLWDTLTELAANGKDNRDTIDDYIPSIINMLKRVIRYFGVSKKDAPEMIYPSVTYRQSHPILDSVLLKYIPDSTLDTINKHHRLYVRVDLDKISISLSQARYMLENDHIDII